MFLALKLEVPTWKKTYCSENDLSLSILAEVTGKLFEAIDEWGKVREEVELTIDELEIEAMEATEMYSICLSCSVSDDRESFIGDVRRKGCSFEFGLAAFIEWSEEMPERAIRKMRPPVEVAPESRVMICIEGESNQVGKLEPLESWYSSANELDCNWHRFCLSSSLVFSYYYNKR